MQIRKAVLPIAGLGTRVLPASKVTPKEMLPLVDKPVVQYLVEEAVAAGIEEIILVVSRSKRSIEDHFDSFPELEHILEHKGKHKELEELRHTQTMASYVSVRQSEPLGLGHAILCAKDLVGDEPFLVMLGDELVAPETPCFPQMLQVYEQYHGSVLSLFTAPREQISAYGIVALQELTPEVVKVTHLVEKPSPEKAPSNQAIAGRYLITPDIFEKLERTQPSKRGEIEITDALAMQAEEGNCYGIRFAGERYDTGNPLGLLTTNIAYGLKRPDIAPALREYMRQMLEKK